MTNKIGCILSLALCVLAVASTARAADTLRWDQVQALSAPPAGLRIAYGTEPSQFAELRLPPGPGPHPTAVLIHGGCWLADFSHEYFAHLAEALLGLGFASWVIEYRRLGDAGGGWPNTFLDVATAIDQLRRLAPEHGLDLRRTVFIGHSAGGQLALWAASRDRLPAADTLFRPHALMPQLVIGLAPIVDLEDYSHGPVNSCHAAVVPLMGGTADEQAHRYAAVSPVRLMPLAAPVLLISGGKDHIVPTAHVARLLDRDMTPGVDLLRLPGIGHFEPAIPGTAAWDHIELRLRRFIGTVAP